MPDSSPPLTDNEMQTPGDNDAPNPTQHGATSGNEADKNPTIIGIVEERSETNVSTRSNSPHIPEDFVPPLDEDLISELAQEDKPKDGEAGAEREQPTRYEDAEESVVGEERSPTSTSHSEDEENKSGPGRQDQMLSEEDRDSDEFWHSSSPSPTTSRGAQGLSRSVSPKSNDDDDFHHHRKVRYHKRGKPRRLSSSSIARSEDSKTTRLLEEMADDSPSRLEWLRRRGKDGIENEHLDKVMLMVGLESVKAHFLSIYDRVHGANGQEDGLLDVVLDIVILGNPGTGKKTIAKLYANFLVSLKLLPKAKPLRASGARLMSEHGLPKVLKKIDKMGSGEKGGGVVWIKDVHDIADAHSVLETILSKSVQNPSRVVLIVTGQDHSISGFSPGAHVNFQVPHIFRLPDYTDEELRKILIAMICRTDYAKSIRSGEETGNEESQIDDRDKSDDETEPDRGVEGGFDGPYFQTFIQLISRRRNGPNFENVKTLRKCFLELDHRQIERLNREDTEKDADLKDSRGIIFTKADMLGEEEEELGKRSSAWQELQSMIGLEEVKASVKMLFGQARINHYRELQGKPPIKITLNRCFLGPPGTGKTTVAKLFGDILYDIGLVERDIVVIKPASDLIGGWIGHSEMHTREALEDTEGGVLVIDDVHLLLPGATYDTGHERNTDTFRAAVIDTLVANLQAKPGERRAVILIGYTYVMHELFETSNPGLARRFPMEEAFQFTEYNDDQLCQILELNLHRESLDASPEAVKVARDMLSIARQRPNFGNAGHVENLLSQAKASFVARISPMDPLEGAEQGLQPGDFDPDFDRALKARERFDELFGDMQGMGDIKRQFQGYQDVAARLKIRGHDPRPYIPLAFVFKGPPGTGKTTVARKVGKIFYDMGFLAAPDLIECSVSELVSPYRAAAGKKVIRMFERALGKVLFIDEAYRLGEMDAVDAVGEIVDCMTKERFARKLVIILAGYKDDMNNLMRLNRGLRSRFATDVIFGRMQPEESLAFLKKLVAKLDVQLDGLTPPDINILRISERLARTKSWANGRDVEAFSREVVEYAFIEKAVAVDPSSKVVVTAKELLPLLKRRLARAYREDAEIAGIRGAGKHSDWAAEEPDASTWTGGREHEGIGLAAPDTSTTSEMILSNHNPNGDFQQDQLKLGGNILEDPELSRPIELALNCIPRDPRILSLGDQKE